MTTRQTKEIEKASVNILFDDNIIQNIWKFFILSKNLKRIINSL